MKDKSANFLVALFFIALFGIPIGLGTAWFIIWKEGSMFNSMI
ncbi:unnamed protein product [marine sediment metagenome]|uniref:Uncharacterized protein n=1 Tax=marine sediment metagenome TaxID=412755 RepID=X1V6U3_9ZZZZ